MTNAIFTGTWVENSGTLNGSLSLNQTVTVPGHDNLSNVIYFNDGGFVESISYVSQSLGPNQIQVLGRAPSGIGTGHILLTFYGNAGGKQEIYTLSIYNPKLEMHTVDVFTSGVVITTINWNKG